LLEFYRGSNASTFLSSSRSVELRLLSLEKRPVFLTPLSFKKMREKQSYALPCLGDGEGRSKTTSSLWTADLVYSIVGESTIRHTKREEIMKKETDKNKSLSQWGKGFMKCYRS